MSDTGEASDGSVPADDERVNDIDVTAELERVIDKEHIHVDTDRVTRWTGESDPWVFAYWHHDWAELHEPIVDIDAAARVLVRSERIKPPYGITAGRARWYAYNLLSELDEPGEFHLDREAGKLYFWPPTPSGSGWV